MVAAGVWEECKASSTDKGAWGQYSIVDGLVDILTQQFTLIIQIQLKGSIQRIPNDE